ncbi:hypothetical protein BZA70DRAFT_198464 [Myxozyma melibiosi]|uniref:Uncharacterized protein n=1 Tax=Myxozyma melibiosi TaxID=54550 RepID=A0ABR1F2F2_9ASCO
MHMQSSSSPNIPSTSPNEHPLAGYQQPAQVTSLNIAPGCMTFAYLLFPFVVRAKRKELRISSIVQRWSMNTACKREGPAEPTHSSRCRSSRGVLSTWSMAETASDGLVCCQLYSTELTASTIVLSVVWPATLTLLLPTTTPSTLPHLPTSSHLHPPQHPRKTPTSANHQTGNEQQSLQILRLQKKIRLSQSGNHSTRSQL